MFFPLCGYQNFCFLSKILEILAQKRPNFAQNMLSWTHIGLAGSFGALLVGWLVLWRGLYLARHFISINHCSDQYVISRLTPKRMAKARRRREIGKTKLGISFPHLKKKHCQKHNGPKTKREIGQSRLGIRPMKMTAGQWRNVEPDNSYLLLDWCCYFVEARLRRERLCYSLQDWRWKRRLDQW